MGPTSSKSPKAGADAKTSDAAGQAEADTKVSAAALAEADAKVAAAQAEADAKVAAVMAEADAKIAAAHAEADAKVAAAHADVDAKVAAATLPRVGTTMVVAAEAETDAPAGQIPLAQLKRLKRIVLIEDQGASTERTIRLTPADEVISWNYGTHIVAVTADGQKFSTAAA